MHSEVHVCGIMCGIKCDIMSHYLKFHVQRVTQKCIGTKKTTLFKLEAPLGRKTETHRM